MTDPTAIKQETHHPMRRKLLVYLAENYPPGSHSNKAKAAPTKSDLAQIVFGRQDSSARAMVTRMTAALVGVGVIEEELSGRERLVRLTPAGYDLVRRDMLDREALAEDNRNARVRAPSISAVDRESSALTGNGLQLDDALATSSKAHSNDRPRFHLRHAASLALASLRQRKDRKPGDSHYEQVLLGLLDENSAPESDLTAFYSLQQSWPSTDHKRILLAESILRFQVEDLRRRSSSTGRSAPEFSLISDLLEADADAVLWASGAIDMAHHYLIEPLSNLDQVTARGLLHTATQLMQKTRKNPNLAVASSYRLAKASKVAAGGWSWHPPESQRPSAPNRHESDPLEQEIAKADRIVLQSAEFNGMLDLFDRALTWHVGPWIMRGMPKAEAFFRRAGGPDFTEHLHEWAISERDYLAELLPQQVDDNMRRYLKDFLVRAQPYLTSPFKDVVRPHLNQARALLGDRPIPAELKKSDPASHRPLSYSSLILNNLWTPEMVAADVIYARINS